MATAAVKAPRLVVTGMGHFFPETVLDNAFFDQLDIGSDANWILDRVGIRERRSVLAKSDIIKLRRGEVTRAELIKNGRLMTMAAMSRAPWDMATSRSGATSKPDLVISGTSVPDWDIPANACSIAGQLGIQASGFDCNSACSSFVVDLHVARGLLQSGASKCAAVFNAERYTTRLDYTDRASCVLFGDSATCAIIDTAPDARGLELIDTIVHSDPIGYEHVRLPEGGVFSQNGAAVQKFAVTKTVSITHEIIDRNNVKLEDLAYFIGHQANFRMLSSACQKNGIRDDQHLFNVDTRGNQGASGAPAVLSENWDRYRPGDHIVVAVVGSGLTWGAALFRMR